MKRIINYKIWLVLLSIVFMACNKENNNVEHAMHVVVSGYNGSGNVLQVSIDTVQYDQAAKNGIYIVKPASLLQFNAVYTYVPNGQQRMVTLTDTITKKVVFSKPLPAAGTKVSFIYLFVDGKEMAVPEPAADTATNKLGFYIHYTDSDEPFDMFLYRKDNTGKEYQTYLAQNVKPNTWIYIDYRAGEKFDNKEIFKDSYIYFTKPGTRDQWAFQDTESKSKASAFGLGFPVAGEKGLVQSYFLAQGTWGLERVRLFFPDRTW